MNTIWANDTLFVRLVLLIREQRSQACLQKPLREGVTIRQLGGLLVLVENTNDSLTSANTPFHYTPVLIAKVQNLIMDVDEIN